MFWSQWGIRREGSLTAFASGCVSLNSHEAIFGTQQGPFPFSLRYKISQFGGRESDGGLLLLIQASLLQPWRLKALRSRRSPPGWRKAKEVQAGSDGRRETKVKTKVRHFPPSP